MVSTGELTPDTEELVVRARAGDDQAVELLFTRHRLRLRDMVLVRMDPRLGTRVDPSDVVQDTLAEAHRRLAEYLRDRPIAFYPWLRQIAWNRLVTTDACGSISTNAYDALGRQVQKQLDNGTWSSMTYDAAGRVTDVANFKSDDSVLSTFAYGYAAAGNRLHVAEAGGERVTWTYDATYQLLSETRSGVGGYAHTFTYDPVGNRLTKDDGTEVTTYVYDAANRLQTAEDNSGVTTYTFDANGNQRVIEEPSGNLTTFVWDYENQMVSIEDPLGDVTTYVYTAAEQRVSKETDVETVKFHWAGQNIVQEYDESDVTQADYTLDPRPAPQPFGNLVSQHRDAATSFYHYDALGSTRNLTDDAEVETDDYTYEAFGKLAASSGTTENPFRWVGQVGYYVDEETSLYSLRRRQYGSGDGRFLSEDPIGFAGGDENLYRYVGNRSGTVTDPSGLGPLPDVYSLDEYREMINSPGRFEENLAEALAYGQLNDLEDRRRWIERNYGPDPESQRLFFSQLWLFESWLELQGDFTPSSLNIPEQDADARDHVVKYASEAYDIELVNFEPLPHHRAIIDQRLSEIFADRDRHQEHIEQVTKAEFIAPQSSQQVRDNLAANPDISAAGQPGFGESLIPIWGSARISAAYYEEGRWGWGTFWALMAVADVLLVRSLLTAVGRGLLKLATWEGVEHAAATTAARTEAEIVEQSARQTTREGVEETSQQLQRVVTAEERVQQVQTVVAPRGMKFPKGIDALEGNRLADSVRRSLNIEGRNIGLAEVAIEGSTPRRLVGVSGGASPVGTVPAPSRPIFTTRPSGAMTRAVDSEVKILEDVAQGLSRDSRGTISLFTGFLTRMSG